MLEKWHILDGLTFLSLSETFFARKHTNFMFAVSPTSKFANVPNESFFFDKFSQIEAEGKPVTNQKSSSRCWLFAALNVMRIPFIKAQNIEDFEFSQAHLFYWDKIERSYYFLNKIVELTKRGEEPDSRLMSYLLKVSVAAT